MEFMHGAVKERSEQHTDGDEEDHACIQRIEGGKQFARIGLQRIHRAHAAEDHRGVHERIDPVQPFEDVIAQNAET